MDYNLFIQVFVFLPLLALIISLLIPTKYERLMSINAFGSSMTHLLFLVGFTIMWLLGDQVPLNIKEITIFKSLHYEFYIDFYFDSISAIFLFVGSFLTSLITVYSRYYLHREEGYKRFFNTILFFFTGYNIAVLSGNLETMFLGWEIIGISSFLLIAFYRDRYLPVKNALKVFSIYRIGDIGFILAMWASHHLWHENITFLRLNNAEIVNAQLQHHSYMGFFIAFMLLVAAAAKSAQLPFSSWLPRAMEGPTPSSAIFYGSVSVHLGVFLMLRTFPFWEHQTAVRVLIFVMGLSTSVVTTFIARVQSSIKSQIAYASASQIGIIFMEIALGFKWLALFHFAGNAFFRTYQLLVSPSVVSYLIKEQFFNYVPRANSFEDSWPKKIEYSIYLLGLKEWNLDRLMDYLIWKPLKKIGNKLDFLRVNLVILLIIPLIIVGVVLQFVPTDSSEVHQYFPLLFSFIGAAVVFKAFSERKSVSLAWLLIIMNHICTVLAISFNELFTLKEVLFYLSGVVGAGLVGWILIQLLKKLEPELSLNRFWGHAYEYPGFAFMFLCCCLGLMGFPISTTFIGIDLVFSHINQHQLILAGCTSLSFVVSGIALVRMFARIFLGPHAKTYHETPIKAA